MSTFQRIEGVIYYDSLSDLLNVRERLHRGAWLDDADRWRGRDGEILRDDPATNYHPVLPTLEIPYHTARNLGPRKLLTGNGTETAVLILSNEQFVNGAVQTADDSWGIDLVKWACDNTDLLSRNADSGDVIDVKTGVPIDEDCPDTILASELQDAFHSEYDDLVPTETCALLQRVSRDDLEVAREQAIEAASDSDTETAKDKITDQFLQRELGIDTSVTPPDTDAVLPPDFARD